MGLFHSSFNSIPFQFTIHEGILSNSSFLSSIPPIAFSKSSQIQIQANRDWGENLSKYSRENEFVHLGLIPHYLLIGHAEFESLEYFDSITG